MRLSEENFISFIDFCSEDDCLYISPPRDHQIIQISDDQAEQKIVGLMPVQAPRDEQVIQPCESPDQKKMKKNDKYNLRKSLAWDSAFFTSAGVLEPDELSCMISRAENGEKKLALPGIEEEKYTSTDSISTLATDNSSLGTLEDDLSGDIRASIQKSSKASNAIERADKGEENLTLLGIEEDIYKSTDSKSTLETDNSSLATLEDDLFGDVRASIQKSSKASKAVIFQSEVGSGVNESQLIKSIEKLDIVSQNKLKSKAALKKPNVAMKGSGKLVIQSGSRNGGSTSSLSKPPKIVARASPISVAATKRNSLGANCIKVEKDKTKTLTASGRGAKIPATGGLRNAVPKPLLPVKSSIRSSVATKTQLTPSSIDSLESLSSNSSSRCSLDIVKQKVDSKIGNCSSIGSTVKSTMRTSSINRNQSMSSHVSPHLKPVTKLSSNVSPASSLSEWSSESLSPTSTLNRKSNISRPSLDASQDQGLDTGNQSNDNCSVGQMVIGMLNESSKRISTGSGALVHPDAVKSSGLRMPSPKIGFFDGARSIVQTPNGSMKSHPTAPCDLAGNVSPSRGSKEEKLGKLQPAGTVMAGGATKTGAWRPASEIKPRSPLPLQGTSKVSPKVSTGSRTGKYCSGMPLKVQNRKSPGKAEQCNLQAKNIAPKECNTAMSNPNFGYSERSNGLSKDKISPQGERNGSAKDELITTINGGSSATYNSSFTSEVDNIILSQKVGKGEICDQNNELSSLSNDIKKEDTFVKDQVDSLAQQVGALVICKEIYQKPVDDCRSLCQVNLSREVYTGAQQEIVKLSMPSPSLIPKKEAKVVDIGKS